MTYVNFKPVCNCGYIFKGFIYTPPQREVRMDAERGLVGLRRYDVCFPMVKWEDTEPWKVEDLKKLEVCEDYEQTN